MSNTTIPNLPAAISLTGSEEVMLVQSGTTYRATTQQIANLNANAGTVTSIATTAPISGGTITTTGTISLQTQGITNGYLAAAPANTIKGNNGVSSASPSDLTTSQVMTMLGAAPLASPSFTGTPTAPTPATSDNSNQIATTAFVKAQGSGSGTVTNVATGTGLSGGPITTTGTISLANTAVTPGSYGSTTSAPVISIDQQGRITSASSASITPAGIGAAASSTTITAGSGLTGGGDLSANRTISLAPITNNYLLANVSGGSAAPSATTISSLLDSAVNNTQGAILYRNASTWTALTPGSSGQVLTTGGSSANPYWTTIAGTGTVTSVSTGTGLTGGPITISGTISIANTAVTAGSYGSASAVPTYTVNAQGQLTAAANVNISIPASAINTTISNTGLTNSSITINGNTVSLGGSTTVTASTTGTLTLGTGLSGTSFNGSTNVTAAIANTTVTAGSYGSATSVPTFTVNSQGQLTAASNTSIAIDASQITSGTIASARISGSYTGITGVGTLTAGTWNASVIGTTYGGTGLTGFTAANNAIYSTSSSALTAGTLPIAAGGTGITSFGTGVQTALGQNVTGSGSIVLSTSPTLVTPSLGAASATSVSMTSGTVSNSPVNSTDIANKSYVDSVAQGLAVKSPVLVATTTNITLSGEQTIDGILTSSSRVLVKNQSSQSQNGIYVSSSGAWSRSSDANTWNQLVSAFVFVEEGTTQADTGWVCTVDPGGTLGTTPVTWAQFSGAGTYLAGTGLTLSGNTFSITNTAVSAGSYGSSTAIPTFTVNAQGQLTAASTAVVIAPAGTLSGTTLNSTVVSSSLTSVGTIGTGVWQGTAIGAAYGGTGQSSYTVGDLLYASGTTALSKLTAVATGSVLVSQGTGTAPAYSSTPTVTSLTAPTVYGGTTASSSLTLQSTSGAGTSDSIVMKVGNAGATTALSIATTGIVSFPTTGAIVLPVGTTAQEPSSPASGMLRFNSSTANFEGYNGSAWSGLGGATGGGTDQIFWQNGQTINTSYSIPANINAGSFGPISIASGATVTVNASSTWTVI